MSANNNSAGEKFVYGVPTPGPWVVNAFGGDYQVIARLEPSGVAISSETACEPSDPIATAKLMASAPDLLSRVARLEEALKYARRFLNDKEHDVAFVDAALSTNGETK